MHGARLWSIPGLFSSQGVSHKRTTPKPKVLREDCSACVCTLRRVAIHFCPLVSKISSHGILSDQKMGFWRMPWSFGYRMRGPHKLSSSRVMDGVELTVIHMHYPTSQDCLRLPARHCAAPSDMRIACWEDERQQLASHLQIIVPFF